FDWNVTITDTFFSVCNAANIAIGPDGKAHVAFAINRVAHFEVGTTYNLWPLYDGIGYWNEDMPTFSGDVNALAPPQYGYANSEMVEDVNYIGWMQDVDGDGEVTLNDDIMYYQQHGPSVMPTIAVNDFNEVYVIYTSTTETYEIDVYNYKHLWMRSYNNGAWGDFTHLTEDIVHIFDEAYYPVIGKVTTSSIDYIYNVDISPGLAWSDDHAWQQNRIIHANLDIFTGIGENAENASQLNVSINPNPATDRVMVNFELNEGSAVMVTLNNMTGQLVKEVKRDMVSGHVKIGLDVSDLPAGTYVCTIKTIDAVTTKKVIVQ
ncbi:MAG TPA: T9SS type A sorting domain-containing protein, partial [Bacteroidales bacterium]|nr:T9SS type A sorting domain-containing protein [Bacteroidales bacterium]